LTVEEEPRSGGRQLRVRIGSVEGDAGAAVAAGVREGQLADPGGWVGGGGLFQDDHAGRLEEARSARVATAESKTPVSA